MDVHQADDLLYVLDPDNDVVLKYDISSPSSPELEDFSALDSPAITQAGDPLAQLTLNADSDVAVDDSGGPNDGTIYVATGPGAGFGAPPGKVYAFSATGEFLYEIAKDTGDSINASGLDVIANGGRAGDLYMFVNLPFGASDPKIQHWVDQADGSAPIYDAEDSFTPGGAALGAQLLAVADGGDTFYSAPGLTRISLDGIEQLETDNQMSIVTAPNGRVYAAGTKPPFFGGPIPGPVREYAGTGDDSPGILRDSFGSGATGVAVHGGSSTVYAANAVDHELDVYVTGIVPDLTLEKAETTGSALGDAKFLGTVNPLGAPVISCEFEYGTSTSYGQTEPCEPANLGTGSSPVAVSAQVSGLTPATEYHFRLRVTNDDGSNVTQDATYYAPDIPEATTGAAGPTTRHGGTALLGGTVDANDSPTRWWIEYGTEADLSDAQSSPATEDLNAGNGSEPVEMSHQVGGLEPETTYYFRVVAATDAGSAEGQIRSFTMPAAGEPEPTECDNAEFRRSGTPSGSLRACRAYERVTPADTAGGPVVAGWDLTTADGDKVSYASTSAYGNQRSLGLAAPYIASRSDDGWEIDGVGPPATWGPASGTLGDKAATWLPQNASDDLNHVYFAGRNLNLPGPDGVAIAHYSPAAGWAKISSADIVTGTPLLPSQDGRVVFKGSGDVPVTSGPTGPEGALYQAAADGSQIQVISIDESDTPVDGDIPWGKSGALSGTAVSDDGSHVYFITDADASRPEIHVRINGTYTQAVSAGELDPAEPYQQKRFQEATPDGRYAFFDTPQRLTADTPASTPGRSDLYRYDAATEDLVNLTGDDSTGFFKGVLGISEDGSRVYFYATDNLTSETSGTDTKVYLWEQGEGITLVADRVSTGPVSGTQLGHPNDPQTPGRVSPDGRYVMFSSSVRRSVFDNRGFEEYYRYDAQSDRLDCVSCDPRGSSATGDAYLQRDPHDRVAPHASIVETFGPRPRLTTDGEVVFATPNPLVARDSNGESDVYLWDGDPHLISSGRSLDGAIPTAMTPDGSSIFFMTRAQLVGADTNQIMDLYVAREGGGLADQQDAPTEHATCQGTDCRDHQPPPEADNPGTEQGGSGNEAPRCKAQKRKLNRAERRSDRAQSKALRKQRQVRKLRHKAKRAHGKRAQKLRKRTKAARRQLRKLDRRAAKAEQRTERAARRASRCVNGGAK